MALIICPECKNNISDRAEACPKCGLPAKFFGMSASDDNDKTTAGVSKLLDLDALRNAIISFDHSYQTLFGSDYYITARELAGIQSPFQF